MKLDIILRTHNKINVHGMYEQRYCGVDKTGLIFKCVKSLIESANNSNLNISLIQYHAVLHFKTTNYIFFYIILTINQILNRGLRTVC